VKVIFWKKKPIDILPPPKPFPSMDDSLMSLDAPELPPPKKKSKKDEFSLNEYLSEIKSKDKKKGKKGFDLNEYLGTIHAKNPAKEDGLDLDSMDISDDDAEFSKEIGAKLPKNKKKGKEKTGKGKLKQPKSPNDELDNFFDDFDREEHHYSPVVQGIEELSESRKEIEQAVKKAGKVSIFDRIFGKSRPMDKPVAIDKSLPDVEKMNILLEQSKDSLAGFDLEGARKSYMMAMEVYSRLSAEERKMFYGELTQLYNDRKNAESMGR
jgi:hypothetical protein